MPRRQDCRAFANEAKQAGTQLQTASRSWEGTMNDPEPQTADGNVLWHFTMSLDGFVGTR